MRIGIYGLGRFGAFFAGLLAGKAEVQAWSRNPERPAPAGVRRVGEEELLAMPAVCLCVDIGAMPEVLARIAPHLRPGTLVLDTCSVKELPVRWMRELLPPEVDILASHPMFGPDSGARGVEGLPMILWPARLPEQRYREWEAFFASFGLTVNRLAPEDHDRQAAFTQGLTHYLGRVLAELHLEPSAIGSVGYRRLLGIVEQTCNDTWTLFLDLQRYNPHTPAMRQALDRALETLKARLDQPPARGEGRLDTP
jgi:prephenate dehydrogenase